MTKPSNQAVVEAAGGTGFASVSFVFFNLVIRRVALAAAGCRW
ncbi:MAG: hypothetical protein WEB58_14925 [Planctomycetaceae bacterium]